MSMHFHHHHRARVVLVWIVSVFTLTLLVYALGFRVVLTQSVPRGLYRAVDVPLLRGTLVAFCLSPAVATFATARGYVSWGTCPGGTQPVVKRIGAVAGDTVDLRPNVILVNGAPLPNSATLAHDSRGRALPRIPRGRYQVADGEFWLFATHIPESWDSRYFGPVRRGQILSTARAVWTLNE
jgi:conjugative transfer signal peptidase TraF